MNLLLLLAVLFVAYANGANDNFKGVATLYGSGAASYRAALLWTTVFSFLGAAASVALASTLIKHFSGQGLLPDAMVRNHRFVLAVAIAAGLTVLLASRVGMPVSTTHALTGGLIGAGAVATAGQLNLAELGHSFVMPLALSPVLAAALSAMVFRRARAKRRFRDGHGDICVCAIPAESAVSSDGALVLQAGQPRLAVDRRAACDARNDEKLFVVDVTRTTRRAHFLSAATVCFSRGLNDAPKIAGLLLILHPMDLSLDLLAIAATMAVGGVVHARGVAETVSRKIVVMDQEQALSANLVTGVLVAAASWFGLPVSTTHVSVGALLGVGSKAGRNNRVVGQILMAWLLTLPTGAALGALVYPIITRIS